MYVIRLVARTIRQSTTRAGARRARGPRRPLARCPAPPPRAPAARLSTNFPHGPQCGQSLSGPLKVGRRARLCALRPSPSRRAVGLSSWSVCPCPVIKIVNASMKVVLLGRPRCEVRGARVRALYWQIVTGVGCCGKLGAGRLAPFGLKVEGCIRCVFVVAPIVWAMAPGAT